MDQLTIISKEELFNFWDDLPTVKQVDADNFFKIMKPIRRRILEILLYGIDDLYPISNINSVRYALSANEIRKVLSLNHEEKESVHLSYQNMYFHLQVLEDVGVIKVIGHLVKGKRTTTYYGRTAKTFISANEDELGYASFVRDEVFKQIVKKTAPKCTEATLSKIIDKIERINRPNYNHFQAWSRSENSILRDLPIDYRKLMELFYLLKNVDHKFLEGLEELKQLLRLDT
ncbi:MAG: winged helix-turn-helix domain-containing protein [Candidatus Kariarchaeaceae archaeon]